MAMDPADREILDALEQTRVFRKPRQPLASFGATTLEYYLLTEPSYTEPSTPEPETVVREGKVFAEKPAIVTPTYLLNMEGFGPEARRSLALLSQQLGPQNPGLMYRYRNEGHALEIVSGRAEQVAERIAGRLDSEGKNLSAILIGSDIFWDVSLMKFIYDFTSESFQQNAAEMRGLGLLDPDPGSGVPRGTSRRIEEMFEAVRTGRADPAALKQELDRWGVFSMYEDRFLSLFRRS